MRYPYYVGALHDVVGNICISVVLLRNRCKLGICSLRHGGNLDSFINQILQAVHPINYCLERLENGSKSEVQQPHSKGACSLALFVIKCEGSGYGNVE